MTDKFTIKKKVSLVYMLFFGVGLVGGILALSIDKPMVFAIFHACGMAASAWVANSIRCPKCDTSVFRHKFLFGKFMLCVWPVTECATCTTQFDISYSSFAKKVLYILLFLVVLSIFSQLLGLVRLRM